jgi:hypothetical protein
LPMPSFRKFLIMRGVVYPKRENEKGENMKKLILIVAALLVMLPLVSFAKTVISESELAELTAQQGVTITFSGLSISNVQLSVSSWGDSDGFTGYLSSGWVGTAISMTGNVVALSGAMDIDVGSSGAVSAVRIGLPTLSIGSTTFQVDQIVRLANTKTLSGGQVLGTSYMSGLTATVTGALTITAH